MNYIKYSSNATLTPSSILPSIILSIILSILLSNTLLAEPVMTFFFRPHPEGGTSLDADYLSKGLTQPGKIEKYLLHAISHSPIESGIFCTYGGYLTVSSLTGQVIFPFMQQQKKFNILITEKITPVLMNYNTVHHLEIEEGSPANYYSIEQVQDKDTNKYYWKVQTETQPEDNIIPRTTIVIFAKPHKIYVQTGSLITSNNPQPLLPDIYVKKGINKLSNALYVLNIKSFFSPISFTYKLDKDKKIIMIKPT